MMKQRGVSLTTDSTDKYIDKIVKRYSKLFGLPSQRKLSLYLGLLSLHGGILSLLPLGVSLENFAVGLGFGTTFLLLTLLSDLIISQTSMKTDLIFNLRRCSALSFFSSLIWFGVLLLGALISGLLGAPHLWIRFFFLGFSGALILRLLVLSVTSFAGTGGTIFSSFLQPALILIPVIFMGSTIGYTSEMQFLLFASVSVSAALVTVFIFKYFMDRVGTGSLGIASSVLFKAFLANWTEDLIAPLEGFFEKLGNLEDIKVSLLTFRASEKTKAVIVVPALHPGPFKNLGSSLLPSLIQTSLQDKFDCVVSVPHGLVGHELDVASQPQNQRVVESIAGFVGSSSNHSKATPMVRTESADAKASCQLFGDCAFLTLTTAPKTMEDLPPELNSFIVGEAEKRGLSVLAIDAHNSMGGPFDLASAMKSFREASVDCLEKALKRNRSSFRVGAATVVPKEFTVQDGMGSGGISVIVTEVDGKKSAYVTIDGNNMVSGLRENILSALEELGIADGEVLTTDTHSVCGMIRSARGYNLVGEAIDHLKLITYIKEATSRALDDMESAEASWRTEVISDVKVIGEQQITELTVLADKTTERVKRVAVILFPVAAVILTSLLLFLL
jgi:putative membrane protein